MANSYTQVYVHYVFVVKDRENIIPKSRNEEIQKYISGIIKSNKCKMIAINNMPDHFHLLVGLHSSISVSKLIQEIKASSSKFINDNKWFENKFTRQSGYGAFSYAKSQITTVCKYIENQQGHHKKTTFKEEYIDMLQKFAIDYDEKYLFEFI